MEIINTELEISTMKSRDPVKLKCLKCNNIFNQPKNKFLDHKKQGGLNGSFCSNKCRNLYKIKKIEIKCDLCSKPFLRRPKEMVNSEKYFCSQRCSATYWNSIKWPIEKRHISKPFKPSIKIEKTCSTCSKKIMKIESRIKHSQTEHFFCNKSCQAIYANKTWNKSPRFGINKSRAEKILFDIIKTDFPNLNVLENNRSTIPGGLELDLYIPEKTIAIELNGPCHFIPLFGENELKHTQNKDLIKIKYCQENNIKFFVINIMGLRNQKETLTNVYLNQLKPHLL